MGQSLVENYMHFVFSTKHREPLIFEKHEKKIFGGLGSISNELGSAVISVGGHVDHVHILCNLSKVMSTSVFMQKVKSYSSKWIKSLDPALENFYWQDGYGGFSVSKSDLHKLTRYIENQHIHHKDVGFKEEYLQLLDSYGVSFDERYLWD